MRQVKCPWCDEEVWQIGASHYVIVDIFPADAAGRMIVELELHKCPKLPKL